MSIFRRYTTIDPANREKVHADYVHAKFRENHQLIIGYSLYGSGPTVAVFDYGYFGADTVSTGSGSGGGGSGGSGGYKLASDSRVSAPSPFKGTG